LGVHFIAIFINPDLKLILSPYQFGGEFI
jgi:hypothetical protein